ncbi:MAG: glycerol-3-phosphate 1-O-acyltransferase PlsY, partial [Vulcanimicrobiaceae bacterium]
MTFAQTVLAPAALGFVLGSIPFGVIASRLFYGRDLRSAGSGNIGAANALRTHGLAFGVLVLVLDALKGAAAVLLARALLGGEPAAAVAAAAAVLGHCYTPWLRFRGGKGVATLLGALAALTPLAGLVFALVWLLAVLPSRFSSLGSLLA